MAEVVRMPEVLAGAIEAAIQTWLVGAGTTVTVGHPIAEIETDKAIVELSAERPGTIGALLAEEGQSVAVGEPILVLLDAGEGVDDIAPALAAAGAQDAVGPIAASLEESGASAPARSAASDPAPGPDAPPTVSSARLFASPLVRRLAAQSGIELSTVRGSGPNGRIVRRDLERHHAEVQIGTPAAGPGGNGVPDLVGADPRPDTGAPKPDAAQARAAESPPYVDVPIDRMRRAIARRLTESKSTVPHFYLVADCRVDELFALRATVNKTAPRKISVNDFVVKAVSKALEDVPAANAIWNGDSLRQFASVDVSVAVATEGGLTTPVLRDVGRMSLSLVSATVADLAERGRAGRLKQHELEGGSFSVSNLGMYGTKEFSAILNPPQSGILAVGAARKTPVIDDNGELGVATVMTVTLSADHRVLDGAVAAQWLAAFQHRIENPFTILI